MRVLFLNPGVQEMAAYQCLSAYIRKKGHVTTQVVDPRLFDNAWFSFPLVKNALNTDAAILQEIADWEPDVVGLSVVTDDLAWASHWTHLIQEKLGVPVILGNIQPTAKPELTLTKTKARFAIRGEGEETLADLLDALSTQRPLDSIQGLSFRQGQEIHSNPMRLLIQDLDTLPFPDKDLSYKDMPYLNLGYTTMTGRGCPYRCTFCDNTTSMKLYSGFKTKWARRHSPEYVVEEILWAKRRYGIHHVRFNDEDFSYNKRWLREFGPLYQKKVGLPYFAWVYPNTVDEEIAEILADSGAEAVEMGVQSGAERLRTEIAKRRTPNSAILLAMKSLRKVGIRVTTDIIVGFPTETKKELDKTALLLADARPWHLFAFFLRYYPTTQIFEMAKKERLLPESEVKQLESGEITHGIHSVDVQSPHTRLTLKYQTLFVLIPILPPWFVRLLVKRNWVRFLPHLNTLILTNITKALKPDRFNEFRARGARVPFYEIPRLIRRLFRQRSLRKTSVLTLQEG